MFNLKSGKEGMYINKIMTGFVNLSLIIGMVTNSNYNSSSLQTKLIVKFPKIHLMTHISNNFKADARII